IRLSSDLGKGSAFTLFLPKTYIAQKIARKPSPANAATNALLAQMPPHALPEPDSLVPAVAEAISQPTIMTNEIGDDRNAIQPGDKVVLIVDNDLAFARIVLDMA